MAPTLRKRKTPEPLPTRPVGKAKAAAKPKVAKPATKSNGVSKATKAATPPKESAKPAKATSAPAKGDRIDLEGFGGEIESNDSTKTSLKEIVGASKAGVVIFTYPKASTPGCKLPWPASIVTCPSAPRC
jgi:thioredoxin-dependent peroxiredoxin